MFRWFIHTLRSTLTHGLLPATILYDGGTRTADYGSGFIFLLYLADHLGGALQSVNWLKIHPQVRQELRIWQKLLGQLQEVIGRDFIDIYTNFTIAATLIDQGIYGMSNLFLTPACGSSEFCRIQPADSNSDWLGPWSSTGNSVEGWGVQVFKFTPGSAAPAPLT